MTDQTQPPDICPACFRFYHLLASEGSDEIAKRTDECVMTVSDYGFADRRENAKKLAEMKAKRK